MGPPGKEGCLINYLPKPAQVPANPLRDAWNGDEGGPLGHIWVPVLSAQVIWLQLLAL